MHPSDAALLHRWHASRDAEAFRALVERYAALVFAAAHRVLRNAADAEDVSQACFVTLAGTRNPPQRNLGAWLHTVAVNRAKDHIRSAARRTAREQAHAAAQPVAVAVETEWDDILAQVDGAIAALDEDLRQVIVAHFLEAQSQGTIAQALRVSRQTVNARVKRGIEAVRAHLAERGVVSSSGTLGTVLTTQMAEAAPPALVATLGKVALSGGAGVGGAGALATVSGLLSWKAALGVVVLAILALPLLRIPLLPEEDAPTPITTQHSPAPMERATHPEVPEPTAAHAPPTPPAEHTGNGVLAGVVVGTDGNPVLKELRVVASAIPPGPFDPETMSEEAIQTVLSDLSRSQTTTDGTFRLDAYGPKYTRGTIKATDVASGFESETVAFDLTRGTGESLTIHFRNPGVIRGVVQERNGTPIPNALVTIQTTTNTNATLADERGQFELVGVLPGEHTISAGEAHPEFDGLPALEYTAARQTVVLEEGETIDGIVLDCACAPMAVAGTLVDPNGVGIANTVLNLHAYPFDDEVVHYRIGVPTTTTDAQGRFRLEHYGPALFDVTAQGDTWRVLPPNTVRSGTSNVILTATPAAVRRLSIAVVDDATGEPVTNFNYMLRKAGSSGGSGGDYPGGHTSFYVPEELDDTLTVLAEDIGSAIYTIKPADLGGPRVTIRLKSAPPLRGQVVDSRGNPVAGARIQERPWPVHDDIGLLAQTDAEGHFALVDLDPTLTRISVIPESLPVAEVAIEGRSDWVIRLPQGGELRGVVRSAQGPLPGVTVESRREFGGGEHPHPERTVQTDATGSFQLSGLLPGDYDVVVRSIDEGGPALLGEQRQVATVRAGQATTVVFDVEQVQAVARLQGRVTQDGQAVPADVDVNYDDPAIFGGMNHARATADAGYTLDRLVPAAAKVTFRRDERSLVIPMELQSGNNTLDATFVPDTAALECIFALGRNDFVFVEYTIDVATRSGRESLRDTLQRIPDAGVLIPRLPVGEATVHFRVHLQHPSPPVPPTFTREVVLDPASTTTITLGDETASLAIQFEGGADSREVAVFLLHGTPDPPDIEAMLPEDFEHWSAQHETVFQASRRKLNGPINFLEAGTYTLFALSWPADEQYSETAWPPGVTVSSTRVDLRKNEETEAVLVVP